MWYSLKSYQHLQLQTWWIISMEEPFINDLLTYVIIGDDGLLEWNSNDWGFIAYLIIIK